MSQAERNVLAEAFGGRRGLLDGGLPAVVFVAVNALSTLRAAVWAAVAVGVVLVGVRLLRRQGTRFALSGFFGVAIAAFFAARTGEARGFFLPGILLQAGYAAAFLTSILLRRPVIGLLLAAIEGRGPEWRHQPDVRRAYTRATWIWFAVFAVRVAVQGAFYLAGRPGWLAFTKLAMGWPLFLLAVPPTLALVRRAGHAGAATD